MNINKVKHFISEKKDAVAEWWQDEGKDETIECAKATVVMLPMMALTLVTTTLTSVGIGWAFDKLGIGGNKLIQ